MKSLRGLKIELVVLGVIAALVPGREGAKAELIWSTAVNLGPSVNSPSDEFGPSTSADGLTLYFSSNRPGGSGGYDLWVSTRATVNDDWGPAVNLGQPPNSQYSYWEPSISSDGLSLYFSDGHSPQYGNHVPGGLGGQGDIWVVTRASIHDAWGELMNLGPGVNSQHAVSPSISSDSLSLYFQSHRPGASGHCDIMVATRESTSDSFGDPVFLKNVSGSGPEWTPDISADGLTLFFMRNPGPPDVWAAKRRTTDDDFGAPFRLPPQVNMPGYGNGIPHLSADGTTLYFVSTRPGGLGGWDLWQVPIIPVVDLNADGIVGSADLCIMIDYWGEDYPLCDIGPMPWGDGVVDVEDLKVLAEHLFQEVNDPTLVAHWALDETEGMIAYDSAGTNDGTVFGAPLWQPEGGIVDGALKHDGTTFFLADFVIDPSAGPFSVLAWVKGGAPGQAIISQQAGVNWLMLDPTTGTLVTELRNDGRLGDPLCSDAVISGDDWHRVGFTWDGSSRRLYVDNILVAEDTQAGLAEGQGGLNVGASKNLTAGTFFTGLIDDVRIYNRAVEP